MAVRGIDHINIRTTDIEKSAQFYIDIFDFEFRVGVVIMGREFKWLYDQAGQPIIHFRDLEAGSEATGPIDHIALACDGRADIVERLKARDIPFDLIEGLSPGFSQINLKDPHGIPLELNFRES